MNHINKDISNKDIVMHMINILTKTFILVILISCIIFHLSNKDLVAIREGKTIDKVEQIKNDIKSLTPAISKEELADVSKSIKLAADVTHINDKIITSVAFHESTMNKNAKSSKGYVGYMQATNHDIFEFSEVDFIRGAKKLKKWINYRHGDLTYALASYNGGDSPPNESYDFANKVLHTARNLEKIKEM